MVNVHESTRSAGKIHFWKNIMRQLVVVVAVSLVSLFEILLILQILHLRLFIKKLMRQTISEEWYE